MTQTDEFSFLPGQYINLRVVIDGIEVERQYSICDIGHNEITIGVKKVKSGIRRRA